MLVLQVDENSPFRSLVGVGGIGMGMFFALDGDHTLGRNESRPGRLLDVRDYCKLHIVIHYIARLLGARPTGGPFHVLPVGKVGDDAAGRHVLEEMQNVGIDTALVHTLKGKPTLLSVCFQYPDGTGGNITTSNSAAAELSGTDLGEAANFLIMHGPHAIALSVPEVSLDVRREFLNLATAARAFRVASFVDAEIAPAIDRGMFEMLDLIALNESEVQALMGCHFFPSAPDGFIEMCRSLTESVYPGLKMVVTVGKHGAYAFAEGRFSYCPAPAVPVVSTAGAGDALLAGVVSALAAGLPFLSKDPTRQSWNGSSLATALEFGVLLASYKVSSPHTIHPDATLGTLLKFAEDAGITLSPEVFAGRAT